MDFGSVNWLAVLACVVVSMISGSLWYNPKTSSPLGGKSSARDANNLAWKIWV